MFTKYDCTGTAVSRENLRKSGLDRVFLTHGGGYFERLIQPLKKWVAGKGQTEPFIGPSSDWISKGLYNSLTGNLSLEN